MRRLSLRPGAGHGRAGALLGGVTSLAMVLLGLTGATRTLDRPLEDLLLRLRGERSADDRIALIEINDATLQAYGQWPVPRDQHALLLEALSAAGARAVGFDLLFIGSDRYNVLNDQLLAAQSQRIPNVVHALSFHGSSSPSGSSELPESTRVVIARQLIPPGGLPARRGEAPLLPCPLILEAAGALGHVTVVNDVDGVIRRVPLWLEWQGGLFPAFALRLAALARGAEWPPAITLENSTVRIRWADGRSDEIPVDADGTFRIDYRGDRNAFPHTYAYVDVLRSWARGDTTSLRSAFHGRVVLVASTATGEAAADVGVTPFSNSTPRVYAQANALDGLLRGAFLREPARWSVGAACILFGALLGLFVARMSVQARLIATLVFVLVGAGSVAAALLLAGIILHPVPLLLLPVAILVAVESQSALRESLERDRIKREQVTARSIQTALLPPPKSPREDLDIYAVNIPSRDVSGDYYDWLLGPGDQLFLTLADVSGKGLPAALLAANLQASFRAQVGVLDRAPSEVVDAIHRALLLSSPMARFATLFLSAIPGEGEELHYCSAGHEPALLLIDGTVDRLEATGGAVGLFPDTLFFDRSRRFPPGAWLVVCSDGITEARYQGGELGVDGLSSLLLELSRHHATARSLGGALLSELQSHRAGPSWQDDMTLLIVRRGDAE